MEVILRPSAAEASALAARTVARLVREKPDAVLGLATGSTPLALYKELIRLHRDEGLDFSKVTTFNLDEYVGLAPEHPASYRRFIRENLLDPVGIPVENSHVPEGMARNIPRHCEEYERRILAAGGIDLQILGIGRDGHIGFNEPTSSLASRTRIKTLTEETLRDNARFFSEGEEVPRHVITMGIGTILDSRRCLLLAFGEGKADAIAATVEGPITAMVPASALQFHPRATILLDDAAGSKLTRADYYRWVFENKPDWQHC